MSVQTMSGQILILPAATNRNGNSSTPLSQQRKEELVELWRRFLSGSVQPEMLVIPAQVKQLVEGEIKRMPGQPTSAAVDRIQLEHVLEHYYGDLPVLCVDTHAGPAVIGAGEEEALLFQQRFRDEVGVRVRIHYPPIHCPPAN